MELKEVLHYYLGCEVIIKPSDPEQQVAVFIGFTNIYRLSARVRFRAGPEGQINLLFLKPILHPLSSMTEEESREHQKLMRLTTDGVHVVQIYVPTPSSFHYLLKQGFDLFGLIDSKQAIDSTTLKQSPQQ